MVDQDMKISPAEKYQFLAGGGEMGKQIRSTDWNQTPLGDPANWPQSLRTMVSVLLDNPFGMYIAWGEEYTQIYNDGYRPILGSTKHPEALGISTKKTFAEIWHIIGPMFEGVMQGKAIGFPDFMLPLNRNGFVEECYFDFSYSPIRVEDGQVGGILVTVIETTNKKRAEEELISNKDKLQFAIDATDLATWEIDPVTLKFTGDDRLKEWHGLPKDENYELSSGFERVLENDRILLKEAIENALAPASNGILDLEYGILNPLDNDLKIVRVKGKVIFDETKVPIKFTGTLQNITAQKSAEGERQKAVAAIESSEQSLRLMITQAPVAMCILKGKEYVVEIANERMFELWGKVEADVINKPIFEGLPEAKGQGLESILLNVYETGETFTANERPVNLPRNGNIETTYINFTYQSLKDINGKINGIIAVASEVTEQVTARRKIEASEKEFRQLADSLPELVWTTDSSGNQTFVSRQWKEFTGLEPSDENTFAAMTHPDDLEQVIRVWTDSLQNGKPYKTELRIKNKDGNYCWFYANANPVFDIDGKVEKWVGAFTNINDQKIAENELKIALQKIGESETRFQKIADNAPVLIRMTNTQRLTVYFNRSWLEFRGRKLEEEVNNGWQEGLHPDDAERFFKTYNEAFDKRKEFYTEYRLKRYDGEYRWISHHGAPRFTSDGSFEGYIGACMDIHEQIMYNDYLQVNEEKLNVVIEASELGTWELDLRTKEPIYSKRYLEILGYTGKKKMSHAEILTHLHPDDLPVREKAFKIAIQTGALYYQSRVIWKDGSVHWFEAKGKVFFDESGKPVKMIGTLRDITDEKKYSSELEEREQKFRTLADSMPQFVWTGDAKGNLNYFNQAVYNYTGLSVRSIEENGWLQIVHQDERDDNTKAWLDAVAHGTDFIFEHRFKRYDGEYRWQLSRAIPQKDAGGNIQMWIGTSTDIQDIKEQEQQKDYFISMASHELKTPVTSIKGYVQILQSIYGEGDDVFLLNSLKVVDKQIITLTKLISELLDISKIKSGGLDFDEEDFEMNELVKETVAGIQHIHPTHQIDLTAEGTVMVTADRHRVAQVLINFLTNAVKYSPHSKNIKVRTAEADQHIMVSVEDAGIGINKKDQERIFERFYRVEGKNEKTFPGFGIGLFIASDIIKKHKGSITVISEPGKGSTFSFSLPVNA